MTPEDIARSFTTEGRGYHFARWGRPIVPVVFGCDDATLVIMKSAIEAVVTLAGHKMAETDPELGANLMIFFFRDWSELPQVPGLDHLVPGLGPLCDRLAAQGADRYRLFRFDADGAIRAAFVFLRMGGPLAEVPAEALALQEALNIALLWSEGAFATRPGLVQGPRGVTLHPEMAALLRAAYDPVLPVAARDPSHALRLTARMPSLA